MPKFDCSRFAAVAGSASSPCRFWTCSCTGAAQVLSTPSSSVPALRYSRVPSSFLFGVTMKYYELIVSARDAEVLALMLGERRRQPALEAAAADALADVLLEARLVPHEELPEDRIALNSTVTYRQEPGGTRRAVVLVHPVEADAALGRISVLSPVGRALIGRSAGSLVDVDVPGTAPLTLRILGTSRNRELRAA